VKTLNTTEDNYIQDSEQICLNPLSLWRTDPILDN
jgi:hypothetical protein